MYVLRYKMARWSASFVLLVTLTSTMVNGHGRLREPPSRNSLWREGFNNVPINYDDNGLNCGGYRNQWIVNHGKCGVCGDPYNGERLHENGGTFTTDLIPRRYKTGNIINVSVEITANHKGYFQFNLCPSRRQLSQACLDSYPLKIIGHGKKYILSSSKSPLIVNLQIRLPTGLSCQRCVIQWKWNTGQSFGFDESSKTVCEGCGKQEQFYNCADVAIGSDTSLPAGSAVPTHVESAVPTHVESAVPTHVESAVPTHVESAVPLPGVYDGTAISLPDTWSLVGSALPSTGISAGTVVLSTGTSPLSGSVTPPPRISSHTGSAVRAPGTSSLVEFVASSLDTPVVLPSSTPLSDGAVAPPSIGSADPVIGKLTPIEYSLSRPPLSAPAGYVAPPLGIYPIDGYVALPLEIYPIGGSDVSQSRIYPMSGSFVSPSKTPSSAGSVVHQQ